MGRSHHPKKHIEAAIRYAEQQGWTVELSRRGHAWGKLRCPAERCLIVVYSTPRSEENHARHIRRQVDNCPHVDLWSEEDL